METNFDNKTYYEYEAETKSDRVVVNPTGSFSAAVASNAKFSTVAMILGIISLGLIFIGVGIFLPPALQILAIIFAVKSRKYTERKKMNGRAIAGLVCAIVSLALLVAIWAVIIIIAVATVLSLAIAEGINGALESEGIGATLRAMSLFLK